MDLFKKFAAYYIPHRKLFAADMACAFVVSVCNMFYPMITRNIINVYVPDRNMRLIVVWALVLLAIYILKAGLSYFIQYYGHMMGVRIQVDMRRDAFHHLQRLPFSFFDKTKTGSIMSRVINDTFEIAELAHHGPEDLFLSIVMLSGSFVLLCTMNVKLTLIIFAFIPLLIWFSANRRRKLAQTSMETRAQIGEVNADLQNSIAGVRVSKAFETSEHELEKFQTGNKSYERARSDQYQAMAEFYSGTGLILDLLLLVTLFAGAFFAYNGGINAGEFAAYLIFVGLFTEPIKRLINFVEQLQAGMTGFVRIQELLSAEPEADTEGAVELADVCGAIAFEHVSFRYDGGQHVLHDINMKIAPGETLALVGPSGGGKSTLCHLLPRFYEIDGGRITIDGRDIREYTLLSLRQQIGIVQQDTFLFAGTIRDNIAYGDFDATDDEIMRAAKNASVDDFILSLPDGLDTYVGERGVTLSGGQKQRIAIARVFLKNPKILILDEATSALDNTTEVQIQSALDELSVGRTTLVVAHRLSTVRYADKIVVLTARGIEEEGTHEELLARSGLYAKLWNAQEHKNL
ncbi:ABC transporter ATP-binding protein/permease [Synergistaceae bacterium OttesenSCG-928-D05]|nr:ABC transporter ATP-binding protein/permease [Synergistaceae bacterium OttesenSCG-928-D05]